MPEITPELIARLRELDKKASPAPWKESGNPDNPEMPRFIEDANGGLVAEGGTEWESFWFYIDNPILTFLELRNALPALLDDRDRLEAENKKLRERLEEASVFRRDLVQATGATAYERAVHDAYKACEYMTEQERDLLLEANPYKEQDND